MKKILFWSAVTLFAAVSCNKELENGTPAFSGADNAPASFTATVDGGQDTRTVLGDKDGDKVPVLWDGKEQIRVLGAENTAKVYEATVTKAAKAVFEAADDAALTGTDRLAVYPASQAAKWDGTLANPITGLNLPAEQTAVAGSFAQGGHIAVAYTVEGNNSLTFNNVTSLIKFTVAETGVKEVRLQSGNGGVMAGDFDLTVTGPTLGWSGESYVKSTAVTVKGDFESGKDYYAAVLPGAFGKLTIDIVKADGKVYRRTSKSEMNLGRNVVKNLGTVSTEGAAEGSMALLWSYAYEESGVVKGSSPAVSPDGKYVYVVSSAYNLVGVDAATGEQKYDVNLNPESASSDQYAFTPSVATDGTVYATGYKSTTNAGLFIVKDGQVSATGNLGTFKVNHYQFGSPALLSYNGRNVAIVGVREISNSDANMGGGSAHIQIFDAETAAGIVGVHANSGSNGSPVVLKNSGVILASTGGDYGTRVLFPDAEKFWRFNQPQSDNNNNGNLFANSYRGSPFGCYMAVDKNGTTVYAVALGRTSTKTEVQRYDLADAIANPHTVKPSPTWTYTFESGAVKKREAIGGVVVDETGNLYATTPNPGHVAAISGTDGTQLWLHKASGDINGGPALGNDGAVYYCDSKNGSLVKLDAKTGEVLVSLKIADNLISSPTIGPDGTIYCNGVLDSKPTVFAVKTTATAPADSWSQMGGDYTKAANRY